MSAVSARLDTLSVPVSGLSDAGLAHLEGLGDCTR